MSMANGDNGNTITFWFGFVFWMIGTVAGTMYAFGSSNPGNFNSNGWKTGLVGYLFMVGGLAMMSATTLSATGRGPVPPVAPPVPPPNDGDGDGNGGGSGVLPDVIKN